MRCLCQDMRMKAMANTIYSESEHGIYSLIKKRVNERGLELKKIVEKSEDVFVVHTNKKRYVVKGFYNPEKLKAQKLLIKLLKENGFINTYDFIDSFRSFAYDDTVYVWISFLRPARERFYFDSLSNRYAGLELLESFHKTTAKFHKKISVNHFNQLSKWEERWEEFNENIKRVEKYVDSDVIQTWLKWGDTALTGLRKYEKDLYNEPSVINHGDVAHHNFFYTKDGTLNLIDFDLINKAPPLIDYLQYANRIMPFIQDGEELWQYRQLRVYNDNPAFLYALLFPTDIFREWNRIVREKLYKDHGYLHSVWEMTVEELDHRLQIYKDISKRL